MITKLVRTSKQDVKPDQEQFYYEINCNLKYIQYIQYIKYINFAGDFSHKIIRTENVDNSENIPFTVKIFNYELKSHKNNDCSFFEYHNGTGGKGCQYIGFFDRTYDNTVFDDFDKEYNKLIFTNVSEYNIINKEDYNGIPKDIDFKCSKLEYGKTKVIIKEDTEMRDWTNLTGEYVIVGNTSYPICVLECDRESLDERIFRNYHNYKDEREKAPNANLYDNFKHSFIKYLLSDDKEKTSFDVYAGLNHNIISCEISNIFIKKNNIIYGKKNIDKTKNIVVLMEELMSYIKKKNLKDIDNIKPDIHRDKIEIDSDIEKKKKDDELAEIKAKKKEEEERQKIEEKKRKHDELQSKIKQNRENIKNQNSEDKQKENYKIYLKTDIGIRYPISYEQYKYYSNKFKFYLHDKDPTKETFTKFMNTLIEEYNQYVENEKSKGEPLNMYQYFLKKDEDDRLNGNPVTLEEYLQKKKEEEKRKRYKLKYLKYKQKYLNLKKLTL